MCSLLFKTTNKRPKKPQPLLTLDQKTRSLCNPALLSQHLLYYFRHLCASGPFTVIMGRRLNPSKT